VPVLRRKAQTAELALLDCRRRNRFSFASRIGHLAEAPERGE
jgi:hypothetical protein